MPETTETRTEKGISLARGPALILGTILLAAGLYFLYKQHVFPKTANFPDGKAPVQSKVFLGVFGANGWTGMLTAVGGGLLLFGAAQHLLAKTMSLIVGVALAAAAIIALVSGDVLGLAAANGWTEIGWGAVAAILLFNTVIPRRRTTVATGYAGGVGRRRGSAAVPTTGAGAAAATEQDRVADRHASGGENVRTQPRRSDSDLQSGPKREGDLAPTGTEHAAGPDRDVERSEETGAAGSDSATTRLDPQP
ncbi:MAG: hypothetical protein ACR2JH_00985 [Solirubrobacteraceae bacterium]